MGVYKINPLSLAGNAAGIGITDIFQYKPGVFSNVDIDDIVYYDKLYSGGDYNGIEFRKSSKQYLTGLPIADRWIEFITENDDGEEDTYYIESPLMRLNQTKNITKTQVYGYEGTIKEYMGVSDWVIDFTFPIFGKRKYELNYDDLNQFLDLNKISKSIDVSSHILNNSFEIYKVTIDSINSIEEHQTYKNIVYVNMTLLSDNDYEPFEKTTTK